ncbi:MAG: hypothetical protein LBJ17_06900 [Dysgonamonadaceae bacterium]|jgi:hypothetical protein|nr:hypothetical protein [Dysgonamonadaceae bacterium]
MKLKDLHATIEILNRQHPFILNDRSGEATYVLEYNDKKKIWEFYFFNERRDKGDMKIFATEEEACRYVLDDAIKYNQTFHESWLDAVRRKYETTD